MTKEEINKKLLDVFGRFIDGFPKFRIVFSDEETEKRFGHFEEFYGDIFVRAFDGVREVPKYSYLEGQWVLEARMITENPELVDAVTYEPIYVFPKHLPLNWDAINFVCNTVLNPPKREFRTESMDAKEEERIHEQRKREYRQFLDDVGDSYLVTKFHLKEAILNPKEKES